MSMHLRLSPPKLAMRLGLLILVLHLHLIVITCVLVNKSFLLGSRNVVLCLLGSILAAEPAHLKPGAVSAHLGRVSLVEDVLWVQYPLTALVGILDSLGTKTLVCPSRVRE